MVRDARDSLIACRQVDVGLCRATGGILRKPDLHRLRQPILLKVCVEPAVVGRVVQRQLQLIHLALGHFVHGARVEFGAGDDLALCCGRHQSGGRRRRTQFFQAVVESRALRGPVRTLGEGCLGETLIVSSLVVEAVGRDGDPVGRRGPPLTELLGEATAVEVALEAAVAAVLDLEAAADPALLAVDLDAPALCAAGKNGGNRGDGLYATAALH